MISAVVSLTLTPMMAVPHPQAHTANPSKGGSTAGRKRVFDRMIAFYGRTLKVVLRYPDDDSVRRIGHAGPTVMLYILIPKGFFPEQDTGVIQGISQAPQTVSFAAMTAKQRDLAKVILADPAVESLSSFIGADGTNTAINSGRFSINLKPLDQRGISAAEVIRRLQPKLQDSVQDIRLFMQPVQNINVDDRVSRDTIPIHARGLRRQRTKRLDQQVRRQNQADSGI